MLIMRDVVHSFALAKGETWIIRRSNFKNRLIDVHCARGSSAFEITRLLAGLAQVHMSSEDTKGNVHFIDTRTRIAPLSTDRRESDSPEHARPARTYIVCNAFETGAHWADRPHDVFNLASDRQRLMLLGHLGHAYANESTTSAFLRSRPVYWSIASVQMGFDLHLTVRDLAHRIGVHPETLRRWAKRAGHLSTERFMMWVRAHAAVAYSYLQHTTLQHAARTLGFLDAAAVRRTAGLLDVRPIHSLRHPE